MKGNERPSVWPFLPADDWLGANALRKHPASLVHVDGGPTLDGRFDDGTTDSAIGIGDLVRCLDLDDFDLRLDRYCRHRK